MSGCIQKMATGEDPQISCAHWANVSGQIASVVHSGFIIVCNNYEGRGKR